MNKLMKLGGIGIATALFATVAFADPAGKPLKVSTGKAYGTKQTSSVIKDPAVDGQVLRVAVTESGQKHWLAGINSLIGEKVKGGTKVRATLWLRVAETEAAKQPIVYAAIQDNDPPRTEWAKQKFTLTDRWAPYVIEGIVPRDMPAYKVNISLHIAATKQTVDVASIAAVNLGPTG